MDNIKLNGDLIGIYRDNGEENGNHYSGLLSLSVAQLLCLYRPPPRFPCSWSLPNLMMRKDLFPKP